MKKTRPGTPATKSHLYEKIVSFAYAAVRYRTVRLPVSIVLER